MVVNVAKNIYHNKLIKFTEQNLLFQTCYLTSLHLDCSICTVYGHSGSGMDCVEHTQQLCSEEDTDTMAYRNTCCCAMHKLHYGSHEEMLNFKWCAAAVSRDNYL